MTTSLNDALNIEFRFSMKIPMRDGIHLSATAYFPKGQAAPAPCIFVLTPYGADGLHEWAIYFAARGFPFVAVDSRGRGNSEGVFRPNIQEARDGYDVVEWLARQSHCNGKVAMYCSSYLGYSQWATAKERPPHLAAIAPTAAPYYGVDLPMRANIFQPYMLRWLTCVSGKAKNSVIFNDDSFWSATFHQWQKSGRPLRDLDVMAGNPSPTFQEWLSHPEPDAFWDAYNPTPDQYAQIDIPILTITGAYDGDQPGALEHYRQHMRHASASARSRHYLIIGPWDHAGTVMPREEVNGLKLGPESQVDLFKLHLEWYAWTMQNGPKPSFLKRSVAYYVTGAEEWRYADSLDAVTARHEPYFLESVRSANDIFSSGSLQLVPGSGKPDSYTYDPRRVDGPEVDTEMHGTGRSLVDQSLTFAMHGRHLIYHSAPLEEDADLCGFFSLSAWIAIDCPDTDFHVCVYEISSNGSSLLLSSDMMRARYREGPRTPKLINDENPRQYDFRGFTFFSRRIRRGHRLRLEIAPVAWSTPAAVRQRNFNAGGVVAEESIEDARPVTVRLFHDATHPSVLYVPLGQPASRE